jgi:hypothetical protein
MINSLILQVFYHYIKIIKISEFLVSCADRKQYLTENNLDNIFDTLDVEGYGYLRYSDIKFRFGTTFDDKKI